MITNKKEDQPYWLRLVVWFVKIGLVVGVFLLISKWINSPVKGKIVKHEEAIDSIVIENNKDKQFNGKFVSYDYSGEYILSEEESTSTDGDKQVLYGPRGSSMRMVIMASLSNDINYDDISAVKMRDLNPDRYEKSNIDIAGSPALLYKRKDEFEMVALCLNNNKLFTMSITANTNDIQMEENFGKMLKSVKWK